MKASFKSKVFAPPFKKNPLLFDVGTKRFLGVVGKRRGLNTTKKLDISYRDVHKRFLSMSWRRHLVRLDERDRFVCSFFPLLSPAIIYLPSSSCVICHQPAGKRRTYAPSNRQTDPRDRIGSKVIFTLPATMLG